MDNFDRGNRSRVAQLNEAPNCSVSEFPTLAAGIMTKKSQTSESCERSRHHYVISRLSIRICGISLRYSAGRIAGPYILYCGCKVPGSSERAAHAPLFEVPATFWTKTQHVAVVCALRRTPANSTMAGYTRFHWCLRGTKGGVLGRTAVRLSLQISDSSRSSL